MSTKLDELKSKLDIVQVVSNRIELHKQGSNFVGICPWHDDNKPSMSVSPAKQLYRCFVCNVGGDAIDFEARYTKVPYKVAMRSLGSKNGVQFSAQNFEVKKEVDKNTEQILKDAQFFFTNSLYSQEDQSARNYFIKRNVDDKLIKEFSLGYAPKEGLRSYLLAKDHDEADLINASLVSENQRDFFSDRIMFAIKNQFGELVGFSGRDISGNAKAKYMNSKESTVFKKTNILYNLDKALEFSEKDKRIIVVEGFMDVIALHNIDIKNVICIMGTALTKNHIAKLVNRDVVLFLDGDAAGIKATIGSVKNILSSGASLSIVDNKLGMDPDEIIKSKGKEFVENMIKDSINPFEYILGLLKVQLKGKGVDQQKAGVKKYIDDYLQFADAGTIDIFTKKLIDGFDVSKIDIDAWIKTKEKAAPRNNTYAQSNNYQPNNNYPPADNYPSNNNLRTAISQQRKGSSKGYYDESKRMYKDRLTKIMNVLWLNIKVPNNSFITFIEKHNKEFYKSVQNEVMDYLLQKNTGSDDIREMLSKQPKVFDSFDDNKMNQIKFKNWLSQVTHEYEMIIMHKKQTKK